MNLNGMSTRPFWRIWNWLTSVACAAALLGSGIVEARSGNTLPKVALLNPAPHVVHFSTLIDGVWRELGYEPGRNLIYMERWAGGSEEQLRRDAMEVANLQVDAIQVGTSTGVRATLAATRSIPVVAVDMESDPVANGWAQSLAKPGGNLTGFFLDLPELSGKRLSQLKEIVPGLSRVAVLWDGHLDRAPLRAMQTSAKALGLRLIVLEVKRAQEMPQAVDLAVRKRAQALVVMPSPIIESGAGEIARLAIARRLPTAGMFPFLADAGLLYTYGPDVDDLVRRCFIYIDRILKGEQPGNLPIQRPEKFDLVLNLKTAAALGFKFPQHFVAQAGRVIE